MSIFIDNIKVMRTKRIGYIKRVKTKLAAVFKMVDMDSINFYLGLKVEKD